MKPIELLKAELLKLQSHWSVNALPISTEDRAKKRETEAMIRLYKDSIKRLKK